MIHSDLRMVARTEHHDPRVHREYLIERFRVVFDSGSTWFCPCAEFAASDECSHTREAAGRRAAQTQIARQVAAGRSQLAVTSPRSMRR